MKIDSEWLAVHADELTATHRPVCCYCGKRLGRGSIVDHHWPYFDDYSYHLSCRRKHKDNPVKHFYRQRLIATREDAIAELQRLAEDVKK